MAKITFVLGGARSGKSAFAEGLAKKYNDVVYIATAEVKDDEMRERIRAHRARRPFHWKTIESPYHVDRVVSNLNGEGGLVFIDCITLYITNLLLYEESVSIPLQTKRHDAVSSGEMANVTDLLAASKENPKQKQEQILAEISKLSRVCRESGSDVIIISNEVGLGIVPDNALSRIFRDIAGFANQILAEEADEVYFIMAGIAQRIK